MSASNPPPSSGYSRAFESFVQGADDLLGLLAYALYKKAIQEARIAGKAVPQSDNRDPSDAEQRAYRSLAKDLLDTFGESAQNSARENILDGGLRPDLKILKDELLARIDLRTSWWPAFLVNLGAWIASIALTVLLAVAVAAPTWIPKVRALLGF